MCGAGSAGTEMGTPSQTWTLLGCLLNRRCGSKLTEYTRLLLVSAALLLFAVYTYLAVARAMVSLTRVYADAGQTGTLNMRQL